MKIEMLEGTGAYPYDNYLFDGEPTLARNAAECDKRLATLK